MSFSNSFYSMKTWIPVRKNSSKGLIEGEWCVYLPLVCRSMSVRTTMVSKRLTSTEVREENTHGECAVNIALWPQSEWTLNVRLLCKGIRVFYSVTNLNRLSNHNIGDIWKIGFVAFWWWDRLNAILAVRWIFAWSPKGMCEQC